jgi:hypothetical protein
MPDIVIEGIISPYKTLNNTYVPVLNINTVGRTTIEPDQVDAELGYLTELTVNEFADRKIRKDPSEIIHTFKKIIPVNVIKQTRGSKTGGKKNKRATKRRKSKKRNSKRSKRT